MFTGKGWRGLLFALAALLVSEAATAERPRRPHRAAAAHRAPHPAIWLLQDSDTKIYLFGTIHILPHGFRWRSPRFNAIARGADELVMEIAGLDDAETMEAVLREMQLGKSAPILWRVSPDRRQALQDLVDGLGLPIERFDNLQTWAAAMVLVAAQIVHSMNPADVQVDRAHPEAGAEIRTQGTDEGKDESAGADAGAGAGRTPPSMAPFAGVEAPLEAEFRASHRPVSGVETITQQMRFFGTLTFAEQRQFLEAMVDAYSADALMGGLGGGGDIGQNAWVHGNVRAMTVGTEELRGPLYDVLLRRRNAAWTEWLIHRLDRPGTLLFAVGAAHLAGEDSVRAMLEARGFRVRRIQ
jgi:uncharacterized protein YbaP (TraB family)